MKFQKIHTCSLKVHLDDSKSECKNKCINISTFKHKQILNHIIRKFQNGTYILSLIVALRLMTCMYLLEFHILGIFMSW